MLKLTWKQLNEEAFVKGIITLNEQRGINNKNGVRIGRICKKAAVEMEKAREAEMKLQKDFQKKDDKGELLLDPTTKQPQWIEGGTEKFLEAFKKMMADTVVEFNVRKVDFAAVQGLTPMELLGLEEIIEGFPSED